MSSRIIVEPRVMEQEEKKTGLDALPLQEDIMLLEGSPLALGAPLVLILQ